MSSKNVQELHVTKASDLDSNTGQTEGMVRMGAVVNKSSNMCASGKVHTYLHTTSTFEAKIS